jgi:hypothetical protein
LAVSETTSSNSSNKSRTPRVKLDQATLLKHIAQELYITDNFNMGYDENDEQIKPEFQEYRENLDLFVSTFKYDNSKAQKGSI